MSHTLLLADDSATIQRVVELAFANEDIDVVTVGDGARAIEAIARDEPDIVLADVSMPGKDGYEVASFVRSDPARARIPVVLLTGAFEPLDEARCGAIGRHEVLVKPFEPRQMIGRVRELLDLPAVGVPAVPDAVAAAEALVADRADVSASRADDAAANVVPDSPPADETGAPAVVSGRSAVAASDTFASRDAAAVVSDAPAATAVDASASRADAAVVSDAPAAAGVDAPASRDDDVAPPADVPASSVSSAELDPMSSAESDTGSSSAESDTKSSAESDTNLVAGSDAETASDPSGRIAPSAGPAVPGAPAHAPADDPPPARPAGLSAPVPPPGGQGVDRARATGRRDGLSASDPPPPGPPANPGGSVLAQAFATFLAVEQGAAPPAPPAADSGAGPRFEVTDALLDELAERVAARLTETVLRDTVAEVVSRIAGRLVREEGEPVPPAGE